MPGSAFNTTMLGVAIRFLSGRKLLRYPDEIEVPARYRLYGGGEMKAPPRDATVPSSPPTRVQQARSESPESDATRVMSSGRNVTNTDANGHGKEEGEDRNMVDWDEHDPDNPKTWPTSYKSFVTALISLLTFSVYIGSSIYTSGISGPNSVMTVFDVSATSALVGLTLFVAGYGIGPMLWAPLTEIPNIGRNPVYLLTLLVFVALQFPTIYANNIHTLLAMRFLAGFFGSPALAVGGATLADMYRPKQVAIAIGVWGCGAVCGPVLGPMLGGFVFDAKGWQWPLWVLTWLSGFTLCFLACVLPETSAKTILYHRALRLRRATGNHELHTQGEIEVANMKIADIGKMMLLRPFVLMLEPIVFALNIYIALVYGLLYIWFESFPLVFADNHHFNGGQNGLAFLGIFVGAVLAMAGYCIYSVIVLGPKFDAGNGIIKPECRLPPMCIGGICMTICLFFFGWSGQYPSVHWIVPIIGSSFFGIGAFLLFQTIFGYLSDAYPDDAASIFAGNDLMRSGLGAAFPLFATAMYHRLGIGGASSLLGGLTALFIPVPFLLVRYGAALRRRSKLARQD